MKNEVEDGGAAFPYHVQHYTGGWGSRGMSLRDWFAGMALSSSANNWKISTEGAQEMANNAYAFADAMLKAREVKQ